ncbi:hypothetical protein E1B28_013130 [Marasmius oreades]|uniref:Tyr recombinase domain-containing protein n=1 Tax=Marasmius oreades TaxID=181124 RepID=A0A9P7RP95_9AGAR|nr:uncharacterized protein E1B28_013130 [Marasmius oreades]KAG7087150.1 hypothetical protein E1B28_013130 [Marasmius oreades]
MANHSKTDGDAANPTTTSISSIHVTSLNTVTTVFAGLQKVVLEYDPADEAFLNTVTDDLDGEREALEEARDGGHGSDQASVVNPPRQDIVGGVSSSSVVPIEDDDGDGDVVMVNAKSTDKPDLGVIKEFSKGVSDGTLAGYLSLIKQLEKWIQEHDLIPKDETFFRADPHEDAPSMIAAWIMDSCDTVKLDGTVRPKSEVRKSYSHAQKMRAAATFGFGHLHSLGNVTWQQSEVTGKMRGNPSVSQQVSLYMISLHRRKVKAGEEATSARAITADIIQKMYNHNVQKELWNPPPPQFTRSPQPLPTQKRSEKVFLGPRFRRLLHLAYTIAFLCLLRVDEVLNITFNQVEVVQHENGKTFMYVTLPYRKTAQGHLCPVRAYAEWVDVLGEDVGFIFRKIKEGDRTGPVDEAMTSQQFLEGFRHNLLDIGIDPAPYGTHSFRRGGCQWLSADLRWPYIKICQWGGWSTELTNATIVKYLVSWNDDPMYPREDFFDFDKSGVRCPTCGRSCLCWGR